MKREDFLKTFGASLLFMPVYAANGNDTVEEKTNRLNNTIVFILVDPSMVSMTDLRSVRHPQLSGVPIVRYRETMWGGDHPAIELYTVGKVTGVTSIQELRIKLGED